MFILKIVYYFERIGHTIKNNNSSMKKTYRFVLILLVFSCNNAKEKQTPQEEATINLEIVETPKLNLKQVNRLAQLPLNCITTEFPNLLSTL